MSQRLTSLIFCTLLTWAISTSPLRADPVVQGIGLVAVVTIAANWFFDMPNPDKGNDFIGMGAGLFDGIDKNNESTEFRLEYWAPKTKFKTRFIGGVFGTTDKGIGGYIGLHHDLFLTNNLVISIETMPTLYSHGDGNDIGSSLVLRSGAGVSYRFNNTSRLSLMVHHMSHAELFSDHNPGVESVSLSYVMPASILFGRSPVQNR